MMTRTNSKGSLSVDKQFERVLCGLERLWMKSPCNVPLVSFEQCKRP